MPRIATHRPDNCTGICCINPTPAAQSLDEVSFDRSACAAALTGNLSRLQTLINKNPSALHDDGYNGSTGYTPLHYAAREGHVQIVEYLLQAGANVNSRTAAGKATPLHRAAYAGQIECVKALLASKVIDTSLVDADGLSAMDKARQRGHDEIVKLLEQH